MNGIAPEKASYSDLIENKSIIIKTESDCSSSSLSLYSNPGENNRIGSSASNDNYSSLYNLSISKNSITESSCMNNGESIKNEKSNEIEEYMDSDESISDPTSDSLQSTSASDFEERVDFEVDNNTQEIPQVCLAKSDQALSDEAKGLKLSEPIVLPGIGKYEEHAHISISRYGIIAVYNSKCDSVEFFSLHNGKHIEIKNVGGYTIVGFYGYDGVALFTIGKPVRWTNIKLSGNRKITTSNESSQIIYRWGDVSRSNITKKVFFINTDLKLCLFYLLHDRVEIIKEVNDDVIHLPSMVGRHSEVYKCIYRSGNDGVLYGLGVDNTITNVVDFNTGYAPSFIIPSTSEPNNIKKALKFYENGKYYIENNEPHEFKGSIQLQRTASIVRVCGNIYIVYDTNTQNWVLVKIIVP